MKLKIRIIRYFLICLVFIYGSSVFAAEYKVADEKHYLEIVDKLQPGDLVIFQNGEWNNVNLIFKADGTALRPIIFRAETKGKVHLTGTSSMKIAGDYLVVDGFSFNNGGISGGAVIEFHESKKKESHYCRLTNTAIVDYNPTNKDDNKWVSLYGDHNRVDHCFFKGKTNKGTTLVVWLSESPNYHLIDSNYFAERPPLGQNGGETIRVGTGLWAKYVSKTVVEHNLFEKCSGEVEIISNKSCENTYRYNTFRDCEGTLTLRNGHRCLVEGNYFFGEHSDHAGGVRIIGEDHVVINNYFQDLKGKNYYSAVCIVNGVPGTEEKGGYNRVKNPVLAFNTFVNNTNDVTIGFANKEINAEGAPLNVTLSNNIFYGSTNKTINIITTPESLRMAGNLYFGSKLGLDENTIGFELKDPKLIMKDGVYVPSNSSPALGNSKGNFDFVLTNINGQKRIGKKDIGCFQMSDSPVINSPLDASKIGPDWMH